MKQLSKYINEWKLTNDSKIEKREINPFNKHPQTKDELREAILYALKNKKQQNELLQMIDTSEITDMSCLFSADPNSYLKKHGVDMTKVEELNLSTWDTSNVSNMSGMFEGCISLKKIICYFNTEKVWDFRDMFWNCFDLEEVTGIEDWDTFEGKQSGMFQGCGKLSLPSWW